MQKLCESCYTLQGDAELILQGKSVFERIDKEIEEGFLCDCFGDVKEKALSLINIDDNWHSDKLESSNSPLNAAKENNVEEKAKLDSIISQRDGVTTGGVSKGGHVRTQTACVIDTDRLKELTIKVGEAKIQLRKVKKSESEAKTVADAAAENYQEWKQQSPHCNHESLLQHAMAIMQPAFDYYDKLFKDDKGDCADMMKMAEADEMFNPIMLSKLFSV